MHLVEPELVPMRGRTLHNRDGSLEFWPYGQREHEVIYSVSRGELNKVMMTMAEASNLARIQFDRGVSAVDIQNHRLTVRAPDGTERTESYEVLIGADGAGSPVRNAVVEQSGGQATSDMLDHSYKELCIPPAEGGGYRLDNFESLHIWPRGGFMLIALPNRDGSFTVTLFLANQGDPSFTSLSDADRVRALFEREFPDTRELIPDVAHEFFSNPTGALGTVRCWPWHVGDVTLIGDACHAIVPFHGQGMNAGFEDCLVLMECLDATDDDWPAAMRQFQQKRKPNADAIAQMALENYVIMRDRVSDPRFQLKKELGFELERRFPDRFIPRYSMVMFHRIPYAEALRRGQIEEDIMDQLIGSATLLEDVDLASAASLIEKRLELVQ